MSHRKEFEDDKVLTIKEALVLIKANKPIPVESTGITRYPVVSFMRTVVKNKKGVKFELLGRASENGYLELIASISDFTKGGEVIFHENGFSTTDYSISFHEYSGTSDVEFRQNHDRGKVLFKDIKKYISFIENRDWVNKKISLTAKTRTYEETYYEIEKL